MYSLSGGIGELELSAGEWQGIPVAIKTVVFQGGQDESQSALIVSEAAIASNLFHKNVVATYCHDIRSLVSGVGKEASVFKFYLLQVGRVACQWCLEAVCCGRLHFLCCHTWL
jgi:hypothetical protein